MSADLEELRKRQRERREWYAAHKVEPGAGRWAEVERDLSTALDLVERTRKQYRQREVEANTRRNEAERALAEHDHGICDVDGCDEAPMFAVCVEHVGQEFKDRAETAEAEVARLSASIDEWVKHYERQKERADRAEAVRNEVLRLHERPRDIPETVRRTLDAEAEVARLSASEAALRAEFERVVALKSKFWHEMKEAKASEAALRRALSDLVMLKDGPRDSVYHREKPKAWERAREALAVHERSEETE